MTNVILKSLKGETLVKSEHICPKCNCTFGEKSGVTIQDCLLAALKYAPCTPDDKPERFKLMMKIANILEWDFDQVEMALLKKCVGIASPTVIFGRLMEVLNAT